MTSEIWARFQLSQVELAALVRFPQAVKNLIQLNVVTQELTTMIMIAFLILGFFFIFIYLAAPGLSYSMWDLLVVG